MYEILLLLYPEKYRRRFGREMLTLFRDMYQDEVAQNGHARFSFWLSLLSDTIKSAFSEQLSAFSFPKPNKYNLIGGLFLLPVFIVFCIDSTARILQGDLWHSNAQVYTFMSHTLFYQYPILVTWVIIFPILAVLINLFSLARHKHNLFSLILITFALGFLAIIKLHDFAPCLLNSLLSRGFAQFFPILTHCRKA